MRGKVYVTGHRGMVGSALLRATQYLSSCEIVHRTREECDLTSQAEVNRFFENERPNCVFLVAAKVGGIQANIQNPAKFIYENLMIQANVIDAAYRNGVKKLLFLGSSCMYPRDCSQPMNEELLFTGKCEPTNEGYAIAKLAGYKMCQFYREQYGCDFITLIPPNLYGINDHYDEGAHVIGSLIRKFHEARVNNSPSVSCWGTGVARREFMFVDDLARIMVRAMENYSSILPLNVGSGEDVSIKDLTHLIAEIVNYRGEIVWDATKPEGMPRKLLDSGKFKALGWGFELTPLVEGIELAYEDYVKGLK